MEKPSYILDIPADEYHAATKANEFISSHRLAVFRRDPLEFKWVIDGKIVHGDTASFTLGRATHTAILEGPEKFGEEYVVCDGPINPKTGKPYYKDSKAYMEWAAEQKKPIISHDDTELIAKMRMAVRGHDVAKKLLAEGFAEGTVRTEWNGIRVQARMDWFNPSSGDLVDLKTCNDLDRFHFDIRDFGYIFQLAFYAECLRRVGFAAAVRPWIVAVEKKDPFRVGVWQISPSTLDDFNHGHFRGENQRDDNDAMLAELVKCRLDDVWPTRFEGYGTI